MNIGWVTFIMFFSFLVLMVAGLPVAFCLGSVGVLTALFLWGQGSIVSFVSNTYGQIMGVVLLAIPLFIFMAMVLERSGIADDLYDMMYKWFGGLKGGLAIGTILVCTIFAAMSGISGAATTTMGLIALPSMLKRSYNKSLAIGCIAAGGALGVLIPPSVLMVILAAVGELSVGKLFLGGVFSGLMLSGLFMLYSAIICYIKPSLGPALPVEMRPKLHEKLLSLRAMVMPIILVIAVLGGIIAGIATPTEAAAVGCLGAIACTAAKRRLNWLLVKETCYNTVRLTTMIMWILIAATGFSAVYTALGAGDLVKGVVANLSVNRYIILIIMQIILLVLGTFMDASGIIMVCTPIFLPIMTTLGFDPIWFGILFVINMEMGFLTPPYGINLFYLRGVVPAGVTMTDIYRAIMPFVCLQGLGLAIIIIFPDIVLWLPRLLITRVVT